MGGAVLVYAFDPVDELAGGVGLLAIDAELAGRLAAEQRVELVEEHANDPGRYLTGHPANDAARAALRSARAGALAGERRRGRPKLER